MGTVAARATPRYASPSFRTRYASEALECDGEKGVRKSFTRSPGIAQNNGRFGNEEGSTDLLQHPVHGLLSVVLALLFYAHAAAGQLAERL